MESIIQKVERIIIILCLKLLIWMNEWNLSQIINENFEWFLYG